MPIRKAYTEAERFALREQYRLHPEMRQQELSAWFQTQYQKQIHQSTVSAILSKRYRYLDEGYQPGRKKRRRVLYPELEEALAQWLITSRPMAKVTGDELRAQARFFWARLPQYQDVQEPNFSNGWLCGFMKRHNISKGHHRLSEVGNVVQSGTHRVIHRDIHREGQSDVRSDAHGEGHGESEGDAYPGAGANGEETTVASARGESIQERDPASIHARLAHFSLSDQYHCDETSLFWKMVPDKSVSTRALPDGQRDKERLTILHCCNASGSHKLPTWIIGRYLQPRSFNAASVSVDRLDCRYLANRQARMTGAIMVQWLQWFDRQMSGRKVALIMDKLSAHQFAAEELAALPAVYGLRNIELIWLPSNSTSRSQPLDHGIVRTFKACYRHYWLRYMVEQLQANRDPMKSMHVLQAVRFIIRAWNDVSKITIANCWAHSALSTRPTPALILPQIAAVQASLEQQVTQLQHHSLIRSRMDIDNFVNPPDELVEDTPEDVAQAIAQQYEPVELEESDQEEADAVPRISPQQAMRLLRQLRLYEEQSDDCNSHWIKSLDGQEKIIEQRAIQSLQQATLASFWT